MDLDIFNHASRKIRCVRSESIPMCGYGDDKHELVVGKEYELEDLEVFSWYTVVKIKGIGTLFNSVLFEELEGYQYVTDTDEYKRWH